MAIIISNAFSLNMLPIKSGELEIKVYPISTDEVRNMVKAHGFISAVGHESTAQLLTDLLGFEVKYNRIPIQLGRGDILIVAQLLERLPEGRVLSMDEINEIVKADKLKFLVVVLKV